MSFDVSFCSQNMSSGENIWILTEYCLTLWQNSDEDEKTDTDDEGDRFITYRIQHSVGTGTSP